MPKLFTVGELARRLNVTKPQLKYALDTYRVEPRQRAGIIRLWSEDDLAAIEAAVKRISHRRGGER